MDTTKLAPPANRFQPTPKTVTVLVSDPVQQPARRTALLLALVCVGVGLRLTALLSDRCLWIDEAMLALNLVDRTPAQLLGKLDYNQGAPVGFLLAAKAGISAFGPGAWAMRLVPFLASVAGLVGFAFVARRLLPAGASLLAVGLFAVSPHLVTYAAECKQYASDAAIAVGLFAAALGLLEGKGGWRWAGLAAAGAAAVWFSHPSVFVLGGIGTGLLVSALVERDRPRFFAAGGTVATWLVSFAACYFLCLKQLGGNKYLTDYWAGHFMSLPPKGLGDLAWLVDHWIAFFTTPGGFGGALVPLGGFAAVLSLVGLREFARTRWAVAVALVTPAVLVLLASGLQKYPIGGRLMLFMTPLAVLLVARGAWAVFDGLSERNAFAARALLALLVLSPVWASFEFLKQPPRSEQLAPVLERVRSEFRPGDRVFVYYGAVPAFTFYTRERPFPAEAVTLGAEHRDDPAAYRGELAGLRGRVWYVVSHRHGTEEAEALAVLDARARPAREVKQTGAAAYLYELE
ncbi:hypothetical protein GobsT_53150 [Gemmata obscuriglobus]|uniref:Uncharacterized protein n=1 Tax=Gemmata obscuriglobus TaxID=114 RepID=A0A2Z3GW66_9BACT|nr:hypothetical protein C1280_07190 [Gemmata obscuriglobus]QEG30510.1 hypothetical protein GobsT_53150 [Gemmata obscuriglobus]VTS09834.1 Uncharacterized protein OS=Chroococcidiopsis thermalis PCC 7203 GN=Chro_5069 PE=4 SV=1: PMT_2 [Gemmata obscuriglobus UQM 2246]